MPLPAHCPLFWFKICPRHAFGENLQLFSKLHSKLEGKFAKLHSKLGGKFAKLHSIFPQKRLLLRWLSKCILADTVQGMQANQIFKRRPGAEMAFQSFHPTILSLSPVFLPLKTAKCFFCFWVCRHLEQLKVAGLSIVSYHLTYTQAVVVA